MLMPGYIATISNCTMRNEHDSNFNFDKEGETRRENNKQLVNGRFDKHETLHQ